MSTPEPRSTGTLVQLSEEECRALLEVTTVGRVAFVDAEGQQLIPLNFAVLNGDIYFRTSPDSVLAQLADGHPDVAFGVDHHDVFRVGWNVTVRGPAVGVTDAATIDRVMGHHQLRPWAGGVRPIVVKVTLKSIDGRRVLGNTT
ncbi:pyridoxamine 5'-phosphate oxidase family protein [Aeromicrobium sp.]|uniref:pyridoxamine 5'-phosphate oxidase family protein n=1 Tax=Aeromicrobium sp. TaxID=1871063 RepID=UPI0030BE20D0